MRCFRVISNRFVCDYGDEEKPITLWHVATLHANTLHRKSIPSEINSPHRSTISESAAGDGGVNLNVVVNRCFVNTVFASDAGKMIHDEYCASNVPCLRLARCCTATAVAGGGFIDPDVALPESRPD